MVPITNILIPCGVSYKDLTKAAKGGQEEILHNVEDHSLDMGICDKTVDTLFHAQAKQTILALINNLSRHTVSMELELEKPLIARCQKKIKLHSNEIADCRQRLNELMGDKTLEYGRSDNRTVVGRDSYFILRTQSELAPIGIPLYEQDDQEILPDTIPAFNSVNEIDFENIQDIRGAKCIRFAGKVYRLRFNELNVPEVLFDFPNFDWSLLQIKLVCLWYKYEKQFVLSEIPAPEKPIGSPMSSTAMPEFNNVEEINYSHIEQLRKSDQIQYRGKTYYLAFDDKDIPKVVSKDPDDRVLKVLQIRLSNLWNENQKNFVLHRPDPVPETTKMNPVVPLAVDMPQPLAPLNLPPAT